MHTHLQALFVNRLRLCRSGLRGGLLLGGRVVRRVAAVVVHLGGRGRGGEGRGGEGRGRGDK